MRWPKYWSFSFSIIPSKEHPGLILSEFSESSESSEPPPTAQPLSPFSINPFFFNLSSTMIIQLQISDAIYASLLKDNTRIQGTIALVNPHEGNFHAHQRHTQSASRKFIKLPHGRASINNDSVRFTLHIGLDEANVHPGLAILGESLKASDFVNGIMKEGGVA